MNRDLTEHWNHLINKSDCKEQTSDFEHWLEWQILIEWTVCLITKKTSVWRDGRLLEKIRQALARPLDCDDMIKLLTDGLTYELTGHLI